MYVHAHASLFLVSASMVHKWSLLVGLEQSSLTFVLRDGLS